MIYLTQKPELVSVPKTLSNYTITSAILINNLTKEEFVYTLIDVVNLATRYLFTLDSTNLSIGEYTIQLMNSNGAVIEQYLARVGEYVKDDTSKQYNTNINTIQYNG